MHHEVIRQKLKRRPFEPFMIVMSSGDRYPVTHPDMVLLARHGVVILTPHPKRKNDLPDYADLSYLHIASLDPLRTTRPRRSA